MANQLEQIIVFSSKRYNENIKTRPELAIAHLVIANKAKDAQLKGSTPADLIDFLSQPHPDADLAEACEDVLEHTRTCGGAGVGAA
jgi:hypothetical protein